jgi:hypothetical protein
MLGDFIGRFRQTIEGDRGPFQEIYERFSIGAVVANFHATVRCLFSPQMHYFGASN